VVPTYAVLGSVALLWAAWIALTRFPDIASEPPPGGDQGGFSQLFRHRHLWFAVFAQFCYCGAQVSTWSAFIPYIKQYTVSTERMAALLLTGSLVAFSLGRIFSTWIMGWLSPAKMISVYGLINIGLLSVGILDPGTVGVYAILFTSFFMSIMFPTIFALGLKDLGPNTKIGGSIIVMSVIGGGLAPPLLGFIAKQSGSYALGYTVALTAYTVVAFYGFYECKYSR
jgi:FHS family L-fucose permease-like MFS transporter